MKLQIICVAATEGAEGKEENQGEKNRQVDNLTPLKEENLAKVKVYSAFL